MCLALWGVSATSHLAATCNLAVRMRSIKNFFSLLQTYVSIDVAVYVVAFKSSFSSSFI